MRKPVLSYANNKGTDQPAHPHSLISTFVVHCLDSIIPLVSISEISSLYLASVAAQASLSLTWTETPEKGFPIPFNIVSVWKNNIWNQIVTAQQKLTLGNLLSSFER